MKPTKTTKPTVDTTLQDRQADLAKFQEGLAFATKVKRMSDVRLMWELVATGSDVVKLYRSGLMVEASFVAEGEQAKWRAFGKLSKRQQREVPYSKARPSTVATDEQRALLHDQHERCLFLWELACYAVGQGNAPFGGKGTPMSVNVLTMSTEQAHFFGFEVWRDKVRGLLIAFEKAMAERRRKASAA
ncbi:MAG: hypothetical protein ABTD50_19320 [Polyangiaceae bacterium]|jgi:hypothetical protein